PAVTDPTPATSEEEADANLGGPICHICQEPTGITRFKEGTAPAKPEQLAVLPCGHQFGHICILEWLDHGVGQSCPLCRSLHQHSKCGHYAMPALASKELPVLKKGEGMPQPAPALQVWTLRHACAGVEGAAGAEEGGGDAAGGEGLGDGVDESGAGGVVVWDGAEGVGEVE
ncbi:hypothetical protein V492_02284, partial [Pseudogymnoascus sp. VKM F-4246]